MGLFDSEQGIPDSETAFAISLLPIMAAKQEGVEDSASLIESLFERLDDLIVSEDHKAAIRTCDESKSLDLIRRWRRSDLSFMHNPDQS